MSKLLRRRRCMGYFEIGFCNFRPIRYCLEIHNKTCPICLEKMNIYESIYNFFFNRCKRTTFKGCNICTFWAHNECVKRCNACPQCRARWTN